MLAFPDCTREFILDTDASEQGIGTVLSQVHLDGQEHVVAFASHVLSKAEHKYTKNCWLLLCLYIIFVHICWVADLFCVLIIVQCYG